MKAMRTPVTRSLIISHIFLDTYLMYASAIKLLSLRAISFGKELVSLHLQFRPSSVDNDIFNGLRGLDITDTTATADY